MYIVPIGTYPRGQENKQKCNLHKQNEEPLLLLRLPQDFVDEIKFVAASVKFRTQRC